MSSLSPSRQRQHQKLQSHGQAQNFLNLIHESGEDYFFLATKKQDEWEQQNALQSPSEVHVLDDRDYYYSPNSFFVPKRHQNTVGKFKCLFIDLDTYKLNDYSPEENYCNIHFEIFYEGKLPLPNLRVFSGRGVQLIYLIHESPIQAKNRWNACQDIIYQIFKPFGADPKTLGSQSILRLPGTFNQKNGRLTYYELIHGSKYCMKSFLKQYSPKVKRIGSTKKSKKQKKTNKSKSNKSKFKKLMNIKTLNYGILKDLEKLAKLRNYDLHGYREMILFLYRLHSLKNDRSPEEALEDTLAFNQTFKEPLPERMVIRDTRSAERYTDKYNFTAEWIIKQLEIDEEELKHLEVVIGTEEKNRRKKEVNREKRRDASGLTEKEKAKAKHLERLKKALRLNPAAKKTELAKELGVSREQVHRLLKDLEDDNCVK
ncbi:replication protein [Natranaerobius thermophilus]|uniref:Replication protein n=1 Tax=Natranaerobius thermophilus (strain ATCC BAA-1301 / DSM 18059 / JW/NM-WN-LF) TaxID=457570 RepID=B2A8Q4_NATTJ|nr:replication protein [Natranaerobius thermophilus]ACB86503.1 replication protein [Natranaerobius thermophilus JW/NM-WN-LF]